MRAFHPKRSSGRIIGGILAAIAALCLLLLIVLSVFQVELHQSDAIIEPIAASLSPPVLSGVDSAPEHTTIAQKPILPAHVEASLWISLVLNVALSVLILLSFFAIYYSSVVLLKVVGFFCRKLFDLLPTSLSLRLSINYQRMKQYISRSLF